MKKQNWILWVGLAVAAWYLWKQSKKAKSGPVIKMPGGSSLMTTPSGSMAQSAANEAKTIVADVVDKTTFLPDMETDRDLYIKDQISCK